MPGKSSWIMVRGRHAGGCVLAVTGRSENVQRIAEEIADGGYDCVGATPGAVAAVCATTCFDLVLLLADVAPSDRARVAARHAADPHQTGILVHLMPAGDVDLIAIIAERLHHTAPRRIDGSRG